MSLVEQVVLEDIRPLSREAYDRLVELGELDDDRLELLYGRLVYMSPQGRRHSYVVTMLTRVLVRHAPEHLAVGPQVPFAASDDSEPEPDIAIVPLRKPSDPHPSVALLVIEVAMTSLLKDREVKAPLYASAGVPEYWIFNLVDDLVEVYSDPVDGQYQRSETIGRDGTLIVRCMDNLEVTVASVLD